MFSKSKRFGDSVHGVSGPGPTTYHVKRLFDDHRPQQPKQRGRKPQALPGPMLLGQKPQALLCKKPLCNDSSKVESKTAAAESNDWTDIFDINARLAQGGTGLVFAGTLKAKQTPVALKRILEKEFDQKLVTQFFKEFEILKRCQHANVVTVFSAYEVPIPAFTMELLGKTLEQSTAEQHIDNDGVLLAFKNAAAAVQYLHSVNIAHRDIKPHNFCHVHSNSWEIKLIDFDAAEAQNFEDGSAASTYGGCFGDVGMLTGPLETQGRHRATIRSRWNQRLQRPNPTTGPTSLISMLGSPKAERDLFLQAL